MSKSEMTTREKEDSPQLQARLVGGLWLLSIVTGVAGFIAGAGPPLNVATDPAALTAKILGNESLFRLGIVFDLVSYAAYLGATVIISRLLKAVSGSLPLVATVFGVVGVAIGCVAWIGHLVPLVLSQGNHYLSAFTPSQLQAMSLTAFNLEMPIFSISFLFFGVQCAVLGYLITRSTFVPRVLGLLLGIGGTSYVVYSFVSLMTPSLGVRLLPFIMQMALIGEGSLSLWLFFKGINVSRWNEQARINPQISQTRS